MTEPNNDSALRLIRLGGAGPNLLLLHGFGSDRMSWMANQDALMQAGSVFACDFPAHGNQPPAKSAAFSDITDAVIGALDSVRDGPFGLIGHSLGGAVAIEVAARRPDLVAALALIAPAGLGAGIDEDFLLGFPELLEPKPALELLSRLVARPRLITPQLAERVLVHLNTPEVRQALRRLTVDLQRVETTIEPSIDTVAKSQIPRIVFWGEADKINPLDRAKLERLKTRLVTLPDTGHLPHVESSKVVNGHLVDFFKPSLSLQQAVEA